jgi:small subunit ribosomal protein S1
VEGMIHVSDISAEKRVQHPRDVLRTGETVQAQVLEIDPERRRLKLGIKQLAPTDIDEYLAEHKDGDVVSGRVISISGNAAQVQLGEGIQASCRISAIKAAQDKTADSDKADVASLSSMLQAKWKGAAKAELPIPQELQAGQVRSFRITSLDRAAKKMEVELA